MQESGSMSIRICYLDREGLERTGSSNDIDKLVGDCSLTTTVVLELQVANHIASILRCVVHSISSGILNPQCLRTAGRGISDLPSANFACVTLNESSVDSVGESEFSKVFGHIILHLICLEARCSI